jgi:hypothetical protein
MSARSLTNRYVHEVVRRVPADQRHDLADELRTTIADTIEARGADDRDATEREVLTEMGDPTQLAARYADRPLALIGPELYSRYVRLLAILLTTVLPVVTVAFVVLDVLDNKDLGAAIVTAVTVVFTLGPQLIAWPTVIFAIVERSRHRRGVVAHDSTWTADDLPDDLPEPDRHGAAACVWALFDALLVGLAVRQHIAKPYRLELADGSSRQMQVLNSDLWSGWIWPVLVGLCGARGAQPDPVRREQVERHPRHLVRRGPGGVRAAAGLDPLPPHLLRAGRPGGRERTGLEDPGRVLHRRGVDRARRRREAGGQALPRGTRSPPADR